LFVEHIPAEVLEEFKTITEGYVNRLYFKNNNALGDLVKRLVQNHPIASIPVVILLPFARMASNIASTVISYSPMGFIR
jgi:hypothetical protein